MKILFVHSNINVRYGGFGEVPAMQLGIASISALLKQHGHQCELLLLQEQNWARAVHIVQQLQPDLVAFTSVTTQFPYIAELSRHLRRSNPRLFQICGGPHVTLVPESALSVAPLDAVCVGEGEYPMLELVACLARSQCHSAIANLYVRAPDGSIAKNPPRPFIDDLDSLPFLDRALYQNAIDLPQYPHSILTTRGCYFQCSYCCNHSFQNIATGRYVRSRSASNILNEIQLLRQQYPALSSLYIEDEAIGLNAGLWEELLPALKDTGLHYGTNYRIGTTDVAFLDKLKAANFVRVNIGIESGNEWIRHHVLNRHYSNDMIVEVFAHARAIGLSTKSYNLIGLPHETPERFEDTIRINQVVHPDETALNMFYPYPQTQLDCLCDQLGIKGTPPSSPICERTETILELPGFPHRVLMHYFKNWKTMIAQSPHLPLPIAKAQNMLPLYADLTAMELLERNCLSPQELLLEAYLELVAKRLRSGHPKGFALYGWTPVAKMFMQMLSRLSLKPELIFLDEEVIDPPKLKMDSILNLPHYELSSIVIADTTNHYEKLAFLKKSSNTTGIDIIDPFFRLPLLND